jgi:hypothetical protein
MVQTLPAQHPPTLAHELGVQVDPVGRTLPPQASANRSTHEPSNQQHGTGCGQVGEHVPVDQTAAQAACVTSWHAPVGRQHRPAGGHGLGLQTREPESGAAPLVHTAAGPMIVHAPVVPLQQITTGHNSGVHVVVSEGVVPAQAPIGPMTMHEPLAALQHTILGHIMVSHVVPGPCDTVVSGQDEDPPTNEHAPVVGLQHRMREQGTGTQDVPAPCDTAPPLQVPSGPLTKHEPVMGLQQIWPGQVLG